MKGTSLLVGFLVALFVLSVGTGAVYGAYSNFSPQEVWTYKPKIDTTYDTTMKVQRDELKTTLYYDVNNDGVTDVLVEIHNYTAKTYSLILLSGADGSVLYKNKFTDIASTHNGNKVGLEANFYIVPYLDSSGNLVSGYQYMIFQNFSDTHRISIYKLNEDLSNASYTSIELPSSISISSITFPISSYKVEIKAMNFNYTNREGLLFMGYYFGSQSGYGFTYNGVKLQEIMLDFNLNVVWEKSEKIAYPSYIPNFNPLGIETTDLNGWGFNGGNSQYPGADLLMLNVSSQSTVITAIEATDGSQLWNITIPGIVVIGSPLGNMSSFISFLDYNNDRNVDIEVLSYDTDSNMTYLYFIDSSGNIVSRFTVGEGFQPVMNSFPTRVNFTTMKRTLDLNGDGYGDSVFIANLTTLVAFDIKDNKTLYEKSLGNEYIFYPVLSQNDINNDGTYDIYLYGLNKSNVVPFEEKIIALDGKTGNELWSGSYENVVGMSFSTLFPKDVADLNQDGFSDEVIMQGYDTDSQGVYMNATVISLKDGSSICTIKVHTNLTDSDPHNWRAAVLFTGDVNDDGTNDLEFLLYHLGSHDSVPSYDSFIRFYDGVNGVLLWKGEVYDDHTFSMAMRMNWKDMYNRALFRAVASGEDVLITTGYSVQDYKITGAIPEFGDFYMVTFIIIAIAVIFYLRKR